LKKNEPKRIKDGFSLPLSLGACVAADMIKAPFVVGARVNRTKVLFTIEDNIKRAGFQSVKSGIKRRFSAASGNPT
jgi:hypothetical protein